MKRALVFLTFALLAAAAVSPMVKRMTSAPERPRRLEMDVEIKWRDERLWIDRTCRIAFPLAYFTVLVVIITRHGLF